MPQDRSLTCQRTTRRAHRCQTSGASPGPRGLSGVFEGRGFAAGAGRARGGPPRGASGKAVCTHNTTGGRAPVVGAAGRTRPNNLESSCRLVGMVVCMCRGGLHPLQWEPCFRRLGFRLAGSREMGSLWPPAWHGVGGRLGWRLPAVGGACPTPPPNHKTPAALPLTFRSCQPPTIPAPMSPFPNSTRPLQGRDCLEEARPPRSQEARAPHSRPARAPHSPFPIHRCLAGVAAESSRGFVRAHARGRRVRVGPGDEAERFWGVRGRHRGHRSGVPVAETAPKPQVSRAVTLGTVVQGRDALDRVTTEGGKGGGTEGGEGGGLGPFWVPFVPFGYTPKSLCTQNGPTRFSLLSISIFPLWSGGGGGGPNMVVGRSNVSLPPAPLLRALR